MPGERAGRFRKTADAVVLKDMPKNGDMGGKKNR